MGHVEEFETVVGLRTASCLLRFLLAYPKCRRNLSEGKQNAPTSFWDGKPCRPARIRLSRTNPLELTIVLFAERYEGLPK